MQHNPIYIVYMTDKQEKKITFIHNNLVERCRKGDESAQAEIYGLYYRAMFNISFRIVGNKAEAEDIMQNSFLKAFRSISSCRENSAFGAWLKRIVVNHSIDALRSRSKLPLEGEEKLKAGENLPSEDEIEDQAGTAEMAEKIRQCVTGLPEGYRIIVSLHLLEGYDHEEIGNILGITASTSRSQYARGKQKLLEMLKSKRTRL